MSTVPAPSRIVILAAIDDTSTSEDVLRTSASLGQALGAELHLVHVLRPVTDVDGGGAVLASLTACLESARSLMKRSAEGARKIFSARIAEHLATGAPWEAILQLAADLRADLIVVGSHGRRGIQRWMLGSVSEEVVRRASCAVLVARPKDYPAAAPEIEPPCGDCLVTQRQTGGDKLWCNRHDHSNAHPRARTHYETPQSFAVGSMLIRPEG